MKRYRDASIMVMRLLNTKKNEEQRRRKGEGEGVF
jgi:hypothetical protein